MAVTMSATLKQNSQSIANNTSSVTLTVKVTSTGGSYNWNGADGTVKFTGSYTGTYNFTAEFDPNVTTTIYTRTFTVNHSSTGTAKVTATITFDTEVSSGTLTKTVSKTLTTIPRASVPTNSGSTIGSAITIKTNRKSTSFDHTITYSFGSASGTIGTDVGASVTWTPPMSLCNQVTTATKKNCTITCKTYNGSTLIGTKTLTISLSVPSSVKPSVSSLTAADASGLLSKYGAYVQTLSTVKLTASAAGSYGSTIKSYRFEFDGGSQSTTSASSQAFPANNTGSKTGKVTVTDSRGRTASKSVTVTVVSYSAPNFTLTAFRSTGGKEDDESTTIRVGVSGSVHNINSKGTNVGTVKIEWKLSTATAWTVAQNQSRGSSFNFYLDLTGKANTSRYNIRVTVTDSTGTASSREVLIGTASPVMDFRTGGEGVAVLGISDRDGFRVGSNMSLSGSLSLENSTGTGSVFITPQSNGRPRIDNHTALASGIWLQGTMDNGAVINLLRMGDESGKVELGWTSGGMAGRFNKQLWTGTWAAGGGESSRITVPESTYYNVFLLRFSGRDARIIAVRNITETGGKLVGTSAFTSGNDNSFTRYAIAISVSTNSWSDFKSVYAYDDSAAVAHATNLVEVRGLF